LAIKHPLQLTERFQDAFSLAFRLHAKQKRKGTNTPYFSHLMGVTALVLEDGGNEDEAIAALLHDAVEDQGGLQTLEDIRQKFGHHVAEIVDGCTDAYSHPKPPWKQRKQDYMDHLGQASPEILRVSLADKLHNARSIHADLQRNGVSTWMRFNGGREGTLWYYRSLVEIFKRCSSSPMVADLERVVEALGALSEVKKKSSR
jgi:(p)ppGpp synthase/HD superfamily hydrolase